MNGKEVCQIGATKSLRNTREHWTGEVSADEWVSVFPVVLLADDIMKKKFVFIKMTYSSRYSFVAWDSRYA